MKLSEVMIWWNDASEHEGLDDKPQVKVLRRMGEGIEAFGYLSNSVGACFGGWEAADATHRAAHVLAVFAMMVGRDGVPAAQAQEELLKIDEYRQWFDEASGPFCEAYWAWSGEASQDREGEAENEIY